MDPITTHCPNGHALEGQDAFCGVCGAQAESDLPTTEPEWAETEPTTAADPAGSPVDESKHSHPLQGVLVALVAVVVIVVGINVMSTSTESSTEQTSDGTNDRGATVQQAEIIGITPYGCDVIRTPGGYDGTMVRIPYCTEVQAIERYCGRDADAVTVPPVESSAGRVTFRDFVGYTSDMGDEYDRFIYTPSDAVVPGATVVRLWCNDGTEQAWTDDEWRSAISTE